MDEDLPSTSHNEINSHQHGHKRRAKASKNAPLYERQREIFDEETLEQIRIFREARSDWLNTKDSTEEAFEVHSELLFGDNQFRKSPWYKKLKATQKSKKPSPEKLARVEEGLEQEKKILKGILKKGDIDHEGEELSSKDFKEDVRFRDEVEYDDDFREDRIRDDLRYVGSEESEDDDRAKDDERVSDFKEERHIRVKDDFKYEKEKRKVEKKGKKEKLLQFKKIPGPEDQCKCDHSGEYTVLVKGVCFCEKPVRPTCIPIIPPAYLNPHMADPAEPDAEIGRVDSLELHRRILPKSPPKARKDKSKRDKKKRKDKKSEGKLIEIYSGPSEDSSQERLQSSSKPKDKTHVKSSKSIQDVKFDFSTHHKAHVKSDNNAPLHFEDLLGEEEDQPEIKKDHIDSRTTPKNPDTRSPFLTKGKISPISDHSSQPVKHEPVPAKPILEKDKKGKTEHGHVHFNTDNQYSDDDWDSSKYYTKYGQAADTHKRQNDKTVMTVLIESFTEWWKGKSKE